jgi:hypothetical protein
MESRKKTTSYYYNFYKNSSQLNKMNYKNKNEITFSIILSCMLKGNKVNSKEFVTIK